MTCPPADAATRRRPAGRARRAAPASGAAAAPRNGSPGERSALDGEWIRIAHLLTLAEALRSGSTLPDEFGEGFDEASRLAAEGREAGAWAGLCQLAPAEQLDRFVQLDLDILALALAADARPSLAPRIQSLQPQIGSPRPSLALLQELLMLDGGDEVATLYDRLGPTAPLASSGLVRVSGESAYQTVRAPSGVARALLARPTTVAPPPGAHLVTRRAGWDELILPPPAMAALRDLVAWIRQRERVISDWRARRLYGPLALFAGPSGSGKTFAASVVATELGRGNGEPWALYALDLGRIMSKYVGETERNLNALLDALDGQQAVLQIDEADGLLGKRGEVSDARDRYANLEVSHMLSRFERHAGPVILTTNLRTNIDPAFLRRFQLVVDFPAPDADARARLWSALLPGAAPREEEVDAESLAAAARLSGGAIHNASFYASILAADERAAIGPRHLARAVWAELNKDQRQVRRSELGELADFLEEEA